MLNPRAFIAKFIRDHEGGLSMDPVDNGNWFDPARYRAGQPQRRNMGVLVGSKYGVTAYALARHRKIGNVTAKMIADLPFEEAVDIGYTAYYLAPRFDLLPWNRVTAAALDHGWLSGQKTSIQILQRMIGVNADGVIGPRTADTFSAYLAKHGEEQAARNFADAREVHLRGLSMPGMKNARFRNGWVNRARSFRPGTAWWSANS